MSTVRITYFNIRGVAELTRLLFVYSEHDFEDERLEREAWPARKPESPLGSVPYIRLENGHEYPQATSIARYFADKFGLRGKTDEEKLHADVVVDLVRADIIPMLTKIFLEQDAEKKESGKKEAQEKIQAWFEKIETKFIKGESTILESGTSWADIALFNCVNDFFPVFEFKLDEKNVKINKVVQSVKANPKIAAWLEKRPESVL